MQPRTTLDILSALVAFDTTSRNSNLACVGWIEDYLARYGVASRRIADDTGTKANLFASIGPDRPDGIILSGHTDVVPVDDQPWSSDPFRLEVRDCKAYGRGTCDMKGYLAAVLAAVPEMVAQPLARPIHLAFSCDEEVGCTGVRPMLAALAAENFRAAACFVGEPTLMEVVIGHKGGKRMVVKVMGSTAHSSLAPTAVNAVEWGARLVAHIRDLADKTAEQGPFDPLYDIPHTTLHVGLFSGGTAPNIVPDEASLTFEVRAIGAESPSTYTDAVEAYATTVLTPRMRQVHAGAGFTFIPFVDVPALDIAPDHEAVTMAKRLAGRNGHAKVAYGTEAGLFQTLLGVPSVVIGPGSIGEAHKADEFIALAELDRADAFMHRLVAELRA
jgi:acetylornithine deacetylase